MHDYREIEAVRWFLQDQCCEVDEIKAQSLSIPTPKDVWHVKIVRLAKELYSLVQQTLYRTTIIYENDIKVRNEADGRAIDIGVPVELSRGVINTASLMEEFIPELHSLVDEMDSYAEKASFGGNDLYEQAARHALRFSHTMRERVPLFLHSYLWILWAVEAVDQAGRIAHRISQDHFSNNTETSFPYMAHPPILVATLACAALIEEVGAVYLHQRLGEKRGRDHTSFKNILEDLGGNDDLGSDFDIDIIQDNLYDTRNNIAHYILKRRNTVSMEEFEDFATAVFECVNLVKRLINDLLFGYIEEQPDFRQGPYYWLSQEETTAL